MIINMTTFAGRQRHYIDRTLASLAESDGAHLPVNLILGSKDTSHVERYRGVLNLVEWTRVDEAQALPGQLRHNCTLNALRALKYDDSEQCLCCEDDISFVRDWFSQLMLTVEELAEGGETAYVLNLGQGCDQSATRRYAVHTPAFLCGAQAIFYPTKAVRQAVADYVRLNAWTGMNDDLIGRYAKQHAVLFNTTPVLVSHIGQVSSFHPPPRQAAT